MWCMYVKHNFNDKSKVSLLVQYPSSKDVFSCVKTEEHKILLFHGGELVFCARAWWFLLWMNDSFLSNKYRGFSAEEIFNVFVLNLCCAMCFGWVEFGKSIWDFPFFSYSTVNEMFCVLRSSPESCVEGWRESWKRSIDRNKIESLFKVKLSHERELKFVDIKGKWMNK